MENSSEIVGSIDDIHQTEEYLPLPTLPVKVQQDGPVQTHSVPSVSGGSRSFAIAATDPPKRVGNEDLRRRTLTLIADQAFYVGETANEVQNRYSARWPANVPCVITHSESVYVGIVVDGTISVLSENWAN